MLRLKNLSYKSKCLCPQTFLIGQKNSKKYRKNLKLGFKKKTQTEKL